MKATTYDNNNLVVSEVINEYESITDTETAYLLDVSDHHRVVNMEPGNLYTSIHNDPFMHVRNYSIDTDPYRPYRGQSLLKRSVSYKHASDDLKLTDSVVYEYDGRHNKKHAYFTNSKGQRIKQTEVYNYDLGPAVIAANTTLNGLNSVDREIHIGTEQWKMGNGANVNETAMNTKLMAVSVFRHNMLPGSILAPQEVYDYETLDPVSQWDYHASVIDPLSPNYVAHPAATKVWAGQALPAYIVKRSQSNLYDSFGNVLEAYLPESDEFVANFYHKTNYKKVVEVSNARRREVAFADFDSNVDGNLHYDKDNVRSYNVTGGSSTAPPINAALLQVLPSGYNAYILASSASSQKAVYVEGLIPGKRYRATFWATDNGVPQFGIENGTQFQLTHIATRGRFKQYEAIFSLATGDVNLRIGLSNNSGVNIGLDDIRICPSNAAMVNRRYNSLFGPSEETDAMGRIFYYEYDVFGRKTLTRDHEGNVLEKKIYGIN